MKLIEILVRELPKRGGWPFNITAAVQDSSGYVYQAGGGNHMFHLELADDWMIAEIPREQYEAALAASKPEWDGEGLPPVGCECEYETNGYGIKKVRVECITMDGIAFTWLGEDPKFRGLDCINTSQSHRFRPIRSEADKKKEEAIKAIDDAQSQVFDQDSTFSEYLYDAIAAGKIPHIHID